jgi:glycosyltransferase involved in cell wall biosynthesis
MAQPAHGETPRDPESEPRTTARRRILLTVHSAESGGAELLALREAEHLKGRYELLLSVPGGPLRAGFGEHGELVRGIATLPLWGASALEWAKRSVRTIIDAFRTARLIRRRSIELVLTNSSVSFAPVLAARLARVPVVVHARDVPNSRLARSVFAMHGTLASTVIVIAGELARYFRRGRRARVIQIADGITVPQRPTRSPSNLSAQLRLCLVGGIDPRKGQDIAVQALAMLHELGVAATLELVGREIDEGFAAHVREQAKLLHVLDSVDFVGEVSDAGANLARADVVIAPSRSEWTPLVLMEALAQCKPVVASRVGGVHEVVSDGRSGLLIGPGDPGKLADAIMRLVADPVAAAQMARTGREDVERRFRIEQTLDRLSDEIDLILRQPPDARSEAITANAAAAVVGVATAGRKNRPA